MYGPTTQCSSKTYQMFQLSTTGPNLCLHPKSSVINDRLLDAWPTLIQMSPQLVNISHKILIDPLVRHCRDSVMYVLKSGMLCHRLGSSRHLTIKLLGVCACTVCWPAVLLELKLVPRLWWYKNVKYTGNRKVTALYMCQKLL